MIVHKPKPSANSVILFILTGLGMTVLVFNLFYAQIVQGNDYLFDSRNSFSLFQIDRARRGIIYDRNGIKLVENVPRYKIYLEKTDDFSSIQPTIDNLTVLLDRNVEEIYKKEYERIKDFENINEVRIAQNLEYNPHIFEIEVNPEKYSSIKTEKYFMRNYLYPELTSHILGYVGEISSEDYRTGQFNYGDDIGKSGVELGYDDVLRGQNGLIRSDRYRGEDLSVLSESIERIDGKNIYLSIDLNLQRKLYELIKQTETNPSFDNTISYGVVAEDVNNGEIIAMASYPTFDSNKFIGGISEEDYQEYLNDPGNPLSNKATQYSQAPGSTFKTITDLAALQEGAINKDTIFEANGTWEYGGVIFQDAGRQRHGNINMIEGLCYSSNIYHMKTALELDNRTNGQASAKLNDVFETMELGEVSGLNIGTESIGYFPTKEEKQAKGEEWFTGNLLNTSIGQGEVRLSPLANAKMASFFASDGLVFPQTIIKDDTNEPKVSSYSKQHFDDIEQGLHCASKLNNVYLGINDADYPNIAIKTGSAETGQIIDGAEVVHGWEISYGPIENPQIAMSVFLENASGGWKGGYISRDFYKYYTEVNP